MDRRLIRWLLVVVVAALSALAVETAAVASANEATVVAASVAHSSSPSGAAATVRLIAQAPLIDAAREPGVRLRPADDSSAPSGAVPCNSFVPGTAVLMADGTTKPIEDVELGDLVWAAGPETSEEGPREVTRLITGHGDKTLVDIEIDGATVTATDHHPIWVNNAGEWVDAEDLQPGDYLLDENGVTVLVEGVDIRHVTDQTVHNLTVDDLHTFFVLAGDNPILTHNNNCPVPEPSPQYLPGGAPNRKGPAAWVNALDESGNVTLHASSPGVHAEVAAQAAKPGAQMSQVWGWRGPTSSSVWRPIDVCAACQGQFPPSLFNPGTKPAPGGVWPQP